MRFFSLSLVLSVAISTSAVSPIISNTTVATLSNTVPTAAEVSQASSQSLPVRSSDIAAITTPTPTITEAFGWQTDGIPVSWSTDHENSILCSTDNEFSTARGPCLAWCFSSACMETASSVAATCSPQWESYIDASEAWLLEHPATIITNYVTITNTSLETLYSSTSTASEVTWTSRHFTLGEELSVENYHPVYVFGKPTGTSTHYPTTVSNGVQSHWVYAENGITTTVTQSPFPTPPPFCDVTEVATNFMAAENCTEYINHCRINGGTVQLYYWPEQATSGPDLTASAYNGSISVSNTGPVLATVSGFTMTSPTVYISLAQIYATDYCGQTIGSDHAGRIIPMQPGDVSSVALQGPFYIYGDSPASPFNYADLQGIVPPQAWDDANMCWDTACYTITNDEYRPYLSIPPEIYALEPGWASCNPNFEGLYDPPLALTTAAAMAMPTYPHAQPKFAIAMASPAGSPAPPSAATPTPQGTPAQEPSPTGSSEPKSSAELPEFRYDPQEESSSGPASPGRHNGGPHHPHSVAIGDIIAGGIGMRHGDTSPTPHSSPESQQTSLPTQTHEAPPLAPSITIGSQARPGPPGNNGDDDRHTVEGQTPQQIDQVISASETAASLGTSSSIAVINEQIPSNGAPLRTSAAYGTPTPVGVVVDGKTILRGETATIGGATIVVDPGNNYLVIDGSQTEQISTMPTATPTPEEVEIMTLGSETYTRVGGHSAGFTIDGEILRPGKIITVDHKPISLAPSDGIVVVDGTTETLQVVSRPTTHMNSSQSPTETTTAAAATTDAIGGPFAPFGSIAKAASPTSTSGAAAQRPSARGASSVVLLVLLLWTTAEGLR